MRRLQRNFSGLCLAAAAFSLGACASYTSKTKVGLDAFTHRDFPAAEKAYEEGAKEEGRDQLLYLFDRGVVRHTAASYAESNKDLLLADRLSEIKDYTALASEAASLFINDRALPYKGEEFETVLVSTYLALNYALLGQREDAIVECRRVNRKLERLRKEGKRDYELNAFAQYLSGLLYEQSGNWNSAYVDYRKTYELMPHFGVLRRDLLRGALSLDSETERDRWERKLGATSEEFRAAGKSLKEEGAVVLIFQNGFAPEKIPSPAWYEIPEYQKRYNKHRAAVLYLNGERVARSDALYDVEGAAIKNLQSKYAVLLLKRAAGLVGREVIGNQVGKATKSDALGAATKILLYAASQADLRAWQTLPKDLQIARASVKPGTYKATIRLEGSDGREEAAERDLGPVTIARPGDISLLNYRSLND